MRRLEAYKEKFINKIICVHNNECFEITKVAFYNDELGTLLWVDEPKVIHAVCIAENASPADEYIWDDLNEFVADYFGSDGWEYTDFSTPNDSNSINCPTTVY